MSFLLPAQRLPSAAGRRSARLNASCKMDSSTSCRPSSPVFWFFQRFACGKTHCQRQSIPEDLSREKQGLMQASESPSETCLSLLFPPPRSGQVLSKNSAGAFSIRYSTAPLSLFITSSNRRPRHPEALVRSSRWDRARRLFALLRGEAPMQGRSRPLSPS